jgi:hypothetical protein
MAVMTAEQAREAAKGLTFEDVWAALMETRQQIAKTSADVANLTKNMDGVNKSLGRWVEEMVYPSLWDKFDQYGYEFTMGSQRRKFKDGKKIIAEADIFLENGEYAMPVETKTTFTEEDVNGHLDRMDKIRLYMDKHNDKRLLVGAIAGAIVPENVVRYAQKNGLYVLMQSGDSVVVAEAPEGFTPRKW